VRASALLLTAVACLLVAAPAPAAGQRTVLNFGDSLAVGTQLYLGKYLGGWQVRAETEVSRHATDVPGALQSFGPARCVVWATIVRPPYAGVSYAGYNRALRTIAKHHPTLHVLDWDAMARAHPSWFGSDGVHPSMTGYRARAAATARLIRAAC
jgi:lysophospholipase L1-like esterase